ncbi:glycine cleavage system H protein [Sporodiniella umbellata]|nr:glycine cleavage system H protein [Sporodiniella umbellata]
MSAAPTSWVAFRTYATKRYTEAHEWISVEGDVGTFGITDYAQKNLGEVVYIETPIVGDEIEREGPAGVVESVKAASDIYSPVSGQIVEVNDALGNEPSLINSSAEDKGWLAKIKLSDAKELESLLDEAGYKSFCDSSDDH